MKKVVLIGEKCLDINQYVEVTRVNPEAPTVVMRPKGQEVQDGMAGNVYNNLVSLGIPEKNIVTFFPDFDIIKRRFIDKKSGYILFRLDENDEVDEKKSFGPLELDKVVKLIENEEVDAIVVSDYCKRYISEDMLSKIFYTARQYEIPTFMDSKKQFGNWSFHCFCIKINSLEYEAQNPHEGQDGWMAQNVLVTRGGDGIEDVLRKKTYPAEKVEVTNVCGAGDSTLAGLVYKYIETKDLEESIKFANKVAAVAVSKKGTYAVKKEDLRVDKNDKK